MQFRVGDQLGNNGRCGHKKGGAYELVNGILLNDSDTHAETRALVSEKDSYRTKRGLPDRETKSPCVLRPSL